MISSTVAVRRKKNRLVRLLVVAICCCQSDAMEDNEQSVSRIVKVKN